MWIVHLVSAVICHGIECHPVLVGVDTPVGQYQMVRAPVQTPGYGGDVLAFAQSEDVTYALHRVWTLKPKQHRLSRLASDNAAERRGITGGCINVMPDVYVEVINSGDTSLKIVED